MKDFGKVLITDADIATVEALHDLLIDNHGYRKDFNTLRKARLLTSKMYKALEEELVCKKCKEPLIEPYAMRYGEKFCLECM